MAEAGLYGSSVGANMVRAAIAELIGTFILVFTGTAVASAAIIQRGTAGPAYDSLAVALAFGLALVAVVAALGHVSGAHVNPAVTISLATVRKFPWKYVPAYVLAQLIGAAAGALATWLTIGADARTEANLGATGLSDGVGVVQALATETLVTFILVFVIASVATDERVHKAVAPLAVGFALACGVLIAGPVTGGAVNPARALGPMVAAGELSSWWVYVVGPVAGGVLAAIAYTRLLASAADPSNELDDDTSRKRESGGPSRQRSGPPDRPRPPRPGGPRREGPRPGIDLREQTAPPEDRRRARPPQESVTKQPRRP